MNKFILSAALALALAVANNAQAAFTLGSSNPTQATALVMDADSISGPMLINVENINNDLMLSWQFRLQIAALNGATGTLTFNDPVTGTPPNPTGYIFSSGVGIAATNTGSELTANDFDPLDGGKTGNLLSVNFSASSDASGYFGVYAVQGSTNTLWADANFDPQFFTNVPDGTSRVLIGVVSVNASNDPVSPVPEPSSLTLLGIGSVAGFWWLRRKAAV